MAKVDQIVALLEGRIARGDYTLRPIPAEVRLASETGVSRMTARKAVLRLLERGLLTRVANGRVIVTPRSVKAGGRNAGKRLTALANMQVGFAAPAYGSAEIDRWRIATERAVDAAGGKTRIVHFHHWDDPVLIDALNSFEALFIVPPAEPVSEALASRLRKGPAKVVALDCDLTSQGIRSVNLVPPSAVLRLLDHLAELGHRTVDCFNSQPVDAVVEQRISQWMLWKSAQRAGGELCNHPDASYGDPPKHAYEVMAKRLRQGPLKSTAIICVTMPAALGVMRALYEKGLRIGKDISVCAINDEGVCAYLCPSLTATRMPDALPYLGVCIDWMAGADYAGPILSQPAEVPLFIGESTGPAPSRPPG